MDESRREEQNQLTLPLVFPFFLFFLISTSTFSTFTPASAGEPQKRFDPMPGVTIMYSANVMGEIDPCGCRINPAGGLTRRYNWQHGLASSEKLHVDSGDLFFGTAPVPPYLDKESSIKAETIVDAYNLLGVEAFTPGELDFAAGLNAFERLRARAKFKMVSANLFRRIEGKAGEKLLLEPHVILSKGGKRIGIFGIADESLSWPPELAARDRIAAARAEVKALRDGGAEIVIALTHEDVEKDRELAEKISGIDLIFGAHGQNFLAAPLRAGKTLIFETSSRGQHIGTFGGGENILHEMGERFEAATGARPAPPTPMDALLRAARKKLDQTKRERDKELFGPR